jgi:IstB-like ATP binding protein
MTAEFDPAKCHDTYTEDVKKLIEDKAKGQKRQAPTTKPARSVGEQDAIAVLAGGVAQCYLPIDQRGADLLFQVISQRYERGSIILTSNKAFKQWATIFNGDSTITSAVLDRLLHHAETVLIEGSSYRMKDRIES